MVCGMDCPRRRISKPPSSAGHDALPSIAPIQAAAGGQALPLTCDVGDPDQVKAMVDTSVRRFRRVDILVNNAGVNPDAGMMPEKVPHEIFEQTVGEIPVGAAELHVATTPTFP
jgi:NAD(P)-dependent dehydrogenase (short-subunit alcohol dehydrogenase family)